MSDLTLNTNDEATPKREKGNKPDLYIQERKWVDGRPVHTDIGVTWDKPKYSSGKLDDGREIVIHTYDQREALFAMRKQKPSQNGETVSPEPSQSPSM